MISLFDPNIAYATAMLAILAVVMAVLAPGTGLLEVGAFFLLALAGYQMTQIAVNWWALGIIAAGSIPLALSLRHKENRLWLGGALAFFFIGSAMLFRGPEGETLGVHPLVALFVTLMEGGFLWFLAEKTIETFSSRPVHDLSRLVGKIGEARTPIHREGSVYVEGELWSAQSDIPIPEGTQVKIVGREGFFLLVKPVSSSSADEPQA